jgi:hypothetical protein
MAEKFRYEEEIETKREKRKRKKERKKKKKKEKKKKKKRGGSPSLLQYSAECTRIAEFPSAFLWKIFTYEEKRKQGEKKRKESRKRKGKEKEPPYSKQISEFQLYEGKSRMKKNERKKFSFFVLPIIFFVEWSFCRR